MSSLYAEHGSIAVLAPPPPPVRSWSRSSAAAVVVLVVVPSLEPAAPDDLSPAFKFATSSTPVIPPSGFCRDGLVDDRGGAGAGAEADVLDALAFGMAAWPPAAATAGAAVCSGGFGGIGASGFGGISAVFVVFSFGVGAVGNGSSSSSSSSSPSSQPSSPSSSCSSCCCCS